jgi:hypothetical protein
VIRICDVLSRNANSMLDLMRRTLVHSNEPMLLNMTEPYSRFLFLYGIAPIPGGHVYKNALDQSEIGTARHESERGPRIL